MQKSLFVLTYLKSLNNGLFEYLRTLNLTLIWYIIFMADLTILFMCVVIQNTLNLNYILMLLCFLRRLVEWSIKDEVNQLNIFMRLVFFCPVKDYNISRHECDKFCYLIKHIHFSHVRRNLNWQTPTINKVTYSN